MKRSDPVDDGLSEAKQDKSETKAIVCLRYDSTLHDRACLQIVIFDGKQGRLLWRKGQGGTSETKDSQSGKRDHL